MKNATWLLVGIGIGFVAAHEIAHTVKGAAVFDAIDTRCREFIAAVAQGYRSREAELRDAVDADS